MSYRIHFVGLVCFIKEADGSYLVALPDGTRGNYPPCATDVQVHEPYVIVPPQSAGGAPSNIMVKSNTEIVFTDALSGTLDDSDLQQNGYHWREIDDGFTLDRLNPARTIARMRLAAGKCEARASSGVSDPAVMTVVTIDGTQLTHKFTVNGTTYTVPDGGEVIVANVAPQWLNDPTYPDTPNHFFIYYTMYNGSAKANCRKPTAKQLPVVQSEHPNLKRMVGAKGNALGLHVDCSNTIYP